MARIRLLCVARHVPLTIHLMVSLQLRRPSHSGIIRSTDIDHGSEAVASPAYPQQGGSNSMMYVSANALKIEPQASSDVAAPQQRCTRPVRLRQLQIALIFTIGLLCLIFKPAQANPTVPQGGSNTFSVLTGMPPAISGWTIKLNG